MDDVSPPYKENGIFVHIQQTFAHLLQTIKLRWDFNQMNVKYFFSFLCNCNKKKMLEIRYFRALQGFYAI